MISRCDYTCWKLTTVCTQSLTCSNFVSNWSKNSNWFEFYNFVLKFQKTEFTVQRGGKIDSNNQWRKKVHWLLLYFLPRLYCAFCFLKLNNKIVNSNQLKFLLHFNIHVCFLLSHRKIPWKCYGMSIATIEIIFPFWNKIFGLLPKFLSTIHITTYTLGHRSAMSQQQFGCHYLSPPNFVKSVGTGRFSDGSGKYPK